MKRSSDALFKLIEAKFGSHKIYNKARQSVFGKGALSYDGLQYSFEISNTLLKHIDETTIYEKPELKSFHIAPDFANAYGIPVSSHWYLNVPNKFENLQDIIIDPCWKELFMFKNMKQNRASFTSYAEYLYDLPPVFVGEEHEFNRYVALLKKEHKEDPHTDFVFWNWHKIQNVK